MSILLTLILSAGAGKDEVLTDANIDRLLNAIWFVESGCRNGPIKGDNGNALGPMQIWRGYHKDATEFSGLGGAYEDVSDIKYAKKVVKAYMARYCTQRRLGREPTLRDFAVMHNGGPNAHKAKGQKLVNVNRYWAKVWKRYQALGG
jgi:hypothetical protein